jgi:GTP-binding protein
MVGWCRLDGTVEKAKITELYVTEALDQVPAESAGPGEIVSVAGLAEVTIGETLADPDNPIALPAITVDEPSLAMTIGINTSPLSGQDGTKLTARLLKTRLDAELVGNVAIRVATTERPDMWEVLGRGELQLAVLVETMRREGFELTIGRPRVLTRINEETGEREEPMEDVLADVDEPYTGVVVEKLSRRKGELQDMRPSGGGKVRLTFRMPSRGLIGYHGEFLTDTRGSGIMNRNGSLISNLDGEAVQYSLWYLQERGTLFVNPGDRVYTGMIVGEHSRENDLDVNVIKEKKLTNIRAAGKDEAMLLIPPRRMSLEQAIAYVEDDELVEVTPGAIRLRKRHLDPNARKRADRAADSDAA